MLLHHIMMTSTTTTKRNNDDTTIDGTNTNKKIKNAPEMSNAWETTHAGDDCGVLHKAMNEHCTNKNITTKNYFVMHANDQRDDGWKETAKVLPTSLIQKTDDMPMVVDSEKCGGDTVMLNDISHVCARHLFSVAATVHEGVTCNSC